MHPSPAPTTAARPARRPSVVQVVVVVGVAVVVLGVAALVWLRAQAGELDQVPVRGLSAGPAAPPPSAAPAPIGSAPVTVPPAAPLDAPVHVLLVGVDTREPDDPAAAPGDDEVAGSRADTIAVVRIDPAAGRLAVVSLPRDLWVEVDGRSGRINSFWDAADPSGLVAAVTTTLGVEVNHYVAVDFAGFRRLVDLAGGVHVAFDAPMRDTHTGFTAGPGCVGLDGDAALAYVRSRHLERQDPATGEWHSDPTSDLGRIARQQDLVVRLAATVLAADYGRTDELAILTDVVDDLTVDSGLDIDTIRSMFASAQQIGTHRIELVGLDGSLSPETIDGADVLVADPAGLAAAAAALVGGTSPVAATVAPGSAAPPSAPSDAFVPTSTGC